MTEEVKGIYWIQVYDREPGTLNGKRVIMEYPFPEVPFAPFGFDLELFHDQLDKIENRHQRLASKTRFNFINERWHPDKFIRVVRKPWKYAR